MKKGLKLSIVLGLAGWSVLVTVKLMGKDITQAPSSDRPSIQGGDELVPSWPTGCDRGSSLVHEFYDVLLQEKPPTFEQEEAILKKSSGIRSQLIAVGAAKPDEAVVFDYLRTHKEWFVPANFKNEDAIFISTLFIFPRTIGHIKEPVPAGSGYVIARFPSDMANNAKPWREIRFIIDGGKISVDSITIEGMSPSSPFELYIKERGLRDR